MADRIEELRRRVQSDPASIAFAALAEEYRRAGQYDEAIATCKAGLRRHPAYLSAHVTLGRTLIEIGQYDEAREELEHVLKLAPENLAAIRGLAEIHHRLGHTETEAHPDADLPPGPPAISVSGSQVEVSGRHDAAAAPTVRAFEPAGRTFEPAASIPLTRAEPVAVSEPAPWEVPLVAPEPAAPIAVESPAAAAPPVVEPQPVLDPALPRLEEFLAAILRERGELEGSGPPSSS